MISIHPSLNFDEYTKWRLAYEGGRDFITQYLKTFSTRESATDFTNRKAISYCPRFAGAGIDDIKNSIYQRLADVTRVGGSQSYQEAVITDVDHNGNSLDSFVGVEVLPELLIMGKVGIYVDMPPVDNSTMLDTPRPYLYLYKREDILNWTKKAGQYTSVLLRDYFYKHDDSGFPIAIQTQFRHLWQTNEGIFVQFYDGSNKLLNTEPVKLKLKHLPFALAEISDSLMRDISDYQIALLNLASADLHYALKSNFPFYTEQRPPGGEFNKNNEAEIQVGVTTGRAYAIGTDRPDFIAPPGEPLEMSMRKQTQLKEEIRLLLNLAITNLRPQRASAESKATDDRSLESGLSYIGLALENTERQIATIWSDYERSNEIPTIHYPKTYQLKTEVERKAEAKQLLEQRSDIPSITYQKEVSKRAASLLLENHITREAIQQINQEIDAAVNMTGNPKDIREDVDAGILDIETAAQLRLYPKGTAKKARIDHAEKLARIQEAQMAGARGLDPEKLSGKVEKIGKPQRGEGK